MYKYIVTYDLKNPGKNYSNLIDKIKTYQYSKVCESAWIIRSNNESSTIRNSLLKEIDNNDCLFVAELSGDAAWYNCIDSAENIKKNLN